MEQPKINIKEIVTSTPNKKAEKVVESENLDELDTSIIETEAVIVIATQKMANSLSEIYKSLNVTLMLADEDSSVELTGDWLTRYEQALTKPDKMEVVFGFQMDRMSNLLAKKPRLEDEGLALRIEEMQVKKFDKWVHPPFVAPANAAFTGGKLKVWVDRFNEYRRREDIRDVYALKALQYKAGEYISTILDHTTSTTAAWRGNVDATLEMLKMKGTELSDVNTQVRKIGEIEVRISTDQQCISDQSIQRYQATARRIMYKIRKQCAHRSNMGGLEKTRRTWRNL